MGRKVYIAAASQISIQKPLSEDWMDKPIPCSEPYSRCLDPDFRQFFSPMQARRMGLLMKRALAVSGAVLDASGIPCPEAIVTGTGLGCIENTELFLNSMLHDGEGSLSPTPFMQSTHNTIGSLIAIQTGCKGYNCTYSQSDISFESALLDAFVQLQGGSLGNALVGSHDETTPDTAVLLGKAGYTEPGTVLSEGSVAMVVVADGYLPSGSQPGGPLSPDSPEARPGHATTVHRPDPEVPKVLCEVADVRILYKPADLGRVISEFGAEYAMGKHEYHSLFGKHCSASGLGTYAAAQLVGAGKYSDILVVNDAGDNVGLVHLRKPC